MPRGKSIWRYRGKKADEARVKETYKRYNRRKAKPKARKAAKAKGGGG